ncbi:MAG TPA: hypothetical protein VKM36_08200 [Balneolaceae bacterium]|nr:hypothetical protein [Balneolaceae bacterium]
MANLNQTKLQIFEFGDSPSDLFYLLIDRKVSPDGINPEQVKLLDPRNFDRSLRELGCLLMFTGDEVEELIQREEIDPEDMHVSVFKLAVKEGVIKQD